MSTSQKNGEILFPQFKNNELCQNILKANSNIIKNLFHHHNMLFFNSNLNQYQQKLIINKNYFLKSVCNLNNKGHFLHLSSTLNNKLVSSNIFQQNIRKESFETKFLSYQYLFNYSFTSELYKGISGMLKSKKTMSKYSGNHILLASHYIDIPFLQKLDKSKNQIKVMTNNTRINLLQFRQYQSNRHTISKSVLGAFLSKVFFHTIFQILTTLNILTKHLINKSYVFENPLFTTDRKKEEFYGNEKNKQGNLNDLRNAEIVSTSIKHKILDLLNKFTLSNMILEKNHWNNLNESSLFIIFQSQSRLNDPEFFEIPLLLQTQTDWIDSNESVNLNMTQTQGISSDTNNTNQSFISHDLNHWSSSDDYGSELRSQYRDDWDLTSYSSVSSYNDEQNEPSDSDNSINSFITQFQNDFSFTDNTSISSLTQHEDNWSSTDDSSILIITGPPNYWEALEDLSEYVMTRRQRFQMNTNDDDLSPIIQPFNDLITTQHFESDNLIVWRSTQRPNNWDESTATNILNEEGHLDEVNSLLLSQNSESEIR